MSLTDVIASLSDGTEYTVTRTATGAYTKGRYTPAASTTLKVTGMLQPPTVIESGRALQVLPEGQHSREIRILWTLTEMFTRTPTNDPDTVVVDSDTWEVLSVAKWIAFDTTHYKAILARVTLP